MQAIKSKATIYKSLLHNTEKQSSLLKMLQFNSRQFAFTSKFSQSQPLNIQFQQSAAQSQLFQSQLNTVDIQKRPKKSKIDYMCKGALPLDRAGTALLPKLPEREVITQYLSEKKITDDLLEEHFNSMISKFMQGLATRDYHGVEKLLEKRLYEKIVSQKGSLEKFQLKYQEPQRKEGDESYIIDKIFVKGVKFNREENDSNHDYLYVDTHENFGLRFYLHKYFLGFHPYYMQTKNEEFFNQLNSEPKKGEKRKISEILKNQDEFRDIYFRQRKQMLERSLSTVLRVTFVTSNLGKLESISGPESLFDSQYSGNHIFIFECQLKTPPSLTLLDHSFKDFINLHKLNFSNWKIVDVDHYFKGNSFFSKHTTDVEWHKDLEAKVGTYSKRTKSIDNEAGYKQLSTILDNYRKFMNVKEPRSLRGLEEIHLQEQAESERKAALLKASEKPADNKQKDQKQKDKKEGGDKAKEAQAKQPQPEGQKKKGEAKTQEPKTQEPQQQKQQTKDVEQTPKKQQ